MKILQNLHTHCTCCDGRDTPVQVVEAALAKGFTSIGFSSHSHTPTYTPSRFDAAYQQEIRALAAQYQDRIEIFCGLEVDSHCDTPLEGYDYLI